MEKFKYILNEKDFLDRLESYQSSKDELLKSKYNSIAFRSDPMIKELGVILNNLEIRSQDFNGLGFMGLNFVNCIFHDIRFKDFNLTSCTFKNCRFTSCHFTTVGIYESSFEDCTFGNCILEFVTMGDTSLVNTHFVDCYDILEIYFGGCFIENVSFTRCSISHSRFSPIFENNASNHFTFDSCFVNVTHFLNLNLAKSNFTNCNFEQLIFSNCYFSNSTFSNCKVSEKKYCAIDLQTIKQSDKIPTGITESLFGIHNDDVKEYVSELTSSVSFQSVFISYSFKDKEFAHKINDCLKSRGVFTFLWEKDAPVGFPNKKIMAENIKKHDRLLFIASENSIRSEACQFELTQGRKKQEELWKAIFFPVHIDNYLFEVEENDIKPKSRRQEYWTNISEIKEISSLDFVSYKEIDEIEFNRKFDDLLSSLRK
jgi:uncharacterized protein YjbI with pentapeptide repeats